MKPLVLASIIALSLIGIIGIQESFAQLTETYPTWSYDSTLDFELYGSDGDVILRLPVPVVKEYNFQLQVRDEKGILYTNIHLPNTIEVQYSEIIDKNAKIALNTQRDIFLLKWILGQNRTLEQLDEIKYTFTLRFTGDAPNSLPDYVDVLYSSHSRLNPPEHESLRVLAPITKVNEMAEIQGLSMITSSEYIDITEPVFWPSESEVAELISKFTPDSYVAPNQQLKNGILLALVKCNEGLELAKKYDNSPACVTPSTAEKLIERGWINEITQKDVQLIPVMTLEFPITLANPRSFDVYSGNHEIETIYTRISGGIIKNNFMNLENESLIMEIDSMEDGIISIYFPNKLFDNVDENRYNNFSTLIDGKKVIDYEDYDSEYVFMSIKFKQGDDKIEIFGIDKS